MGQWQTSEQTEPSVERMRAKGRAVQLPPEYNEYVAMSLSLKSSGLWDWLQTLVLAGRAGAYELCDVVAVLIAFFSHRDKVSALGDFLKRSRVYGPELAAVMDRCDWMSQPAMSRALSRVDQGLARKVSEHLLFESAREVLGHEYVQSTGQLDGKGEGWRVFHWDVTVTPLRRRALPNDEQLPEPQRHGDRIAAPGYPGRKRADTQLSRSTVSDATSALWLHADIEPGNGHLSNQLHLAAHSIKQILKQQPKQAARSVVICDGVSGGLPQSHVLREHGLLFVTRYGRYELLEQSDVLQALEQGSWLPVQDSKSGPKREAISLGTRSLPGGLDVTVIVSRRPLPRSGKHRGAGKIIGSWVYELYLTDLPAERWAGNDVVTLYYGRTAIENRFAAEDRDFGLDRIFSYEGPGQLLAVSVALMVWNQRFARGCHDLPSGSADRATQRTRPTTDAPPAKHATTQAHSTTRLDSTTVSSEHELPVDHALSQALPLAQVSLPTSAGSSMAQIAQAAKGWCLKHPSWKYDDETSALLCPKNQRLRLSTHRPTSLGHVAARFRARKNTCSLCPQRNQCSPRATKRRFAKEVNIALNATESHQTPPPHAKSSASPPPPPPPLPLPKLIPAAPVLLPAVLRREGTNLLNTMEVSVLVPNLSIQQRHHRATAIDEAERQRRRLTIQQRVALNHHPNADQILIHLAAHSDLLHLLESKKLLPRSG